MVSLLIIKVNLQVFDACGVNFFEQVKGFEELTGPKLCKFAWSMSLCIMQHMKYSHAELAPDTKLDLYCLTM